MCGRKVTFYLNLWSQKRNRLNLTFETVPIFYDLLRMSCTSLSPGSKTNGFNKLFNIWSSKSGSSKSGVWDDGFDSSNSSTRRKRVETFTIGNYIKFSLVQRLTKGIIVKNGKRNLINRKSKVFLFDHLSEVNQCVTHATQCCIDAHICLLGNLLKAKTSVMSE